MSELRSSSSDGADRRLSAVIAEHRELLRAPAEEYRRAAAARARRSAPVGEPLLAEQTDRLIADLMIDPVRHRRLDIDAYLAVRDGIPLRYDAQRHRFTGPGVTVHPNGPERRLGIIARLAARGADLDQILTVATVVITHPGAAGEATPLARGEVRIPTPSTQTRSAPTSGAPHAAAQTSTHY
ncbi:hypothetical protein IU500_23445 [Nocardia terpenica]|uniref:hypothetical protein n=1 Tax=Nocardia terpenica TaxID=455432 RepID=UPI0018948AB3|nr:hypothetical protein [Nocardia terpenica]MBF6063623.1 hypothetical protein [Nocardia terpenica]MBF6106999.1 hypothetical protein [Nocardia terpenica]MBF6114172.1 hypothetical protein [Nocardia terpenica]MBF6121741.1 hypothetical protein [Nocardia terpenica]MBF6154156.1 hypothetical protein [Nocardia terpenica]